MSWRPNSDNDESPFDSSGGKEEVIVKDGGPAFPTDHVKHIPSNPGMSLRDYFAAAALTGIIASPRNHLRKDGTECDSITDNVECAFAYADKMIAERNK